MEVSLKKSVFKSSVAQAAILSGLLTGTLAASDDPVYDRLIGNETEPITTEQSLIPERQPQSLGTPRRSDEVIRRIERDRLGELRDYGEPEEEPDPADAFFDSIEWGVVVEGELVSNLNKADSYRRQTDANYTADFGFLMHLGQRGTFYGLLEAGYGEALDGRIPTLSGFNDEIEGNQNLKFTELWYEHTFGCNDSWRFRIGHLDLTTDFDTNNYANSGISQFNSTAFVHNLTLGNEYACPSFGVMLWKDFGEAFSVGAAYLAEDSECCYDEEGVPKEDSWTDVFHHGFGILEADFHLDAGGHEGNLRFYGWVSRSEDYAFTAEGKKGTTAGWGTNFDQELSYYMGVWGRFGYGDAEYNIVTKHYSGGVQFQHFNSCWQRDVIGVGYGISEPGDTIAEELGDPNKEHFVEVYYRRVFNDFAHLSPYMQFVKNPLGDKEADSAFVLGLRGAFEI